MTIISVFMLRLKFDRTIIPKKEKRKSTRENRQEGCQMGSASMTALLPSNALMSEEDHIFVGLVFVTLIKVIMVWQSSSINWLHLHPNRYIGNSTHTHTHFSENGVEINSLSHILLLTLVTSTTSKCFQCWPNCNLLGPEWERGHACRGVRHGEL